MANELTKAINTKDLPNSEGYFGEYGGAYLPPNLEEVMKEIDRSYRKIVEDPAFIEELMEDRKSVV